MDLAASIQRGDRGSDAAHGPRRCTSGPGRSDLVMAGGVALNCVAQRPAAARRAVREHLDPAGGRRRRRRARRRAVRLASAAREAADAERRRRRSRPAARPALLADEIERFLDGVRRARTSAIDDEGGAARSRRRQLLAEREGGRLVPRAGRSSARARSARAASSATPRSPRCRRP